MEWFDIETPVRVGSRGVSKSTGNEPAPFRVTSLDAPHVYADTTELEGVELTVHHEARPTPAGTRVELRAWLEGPRAAEYEAGMREVLSAALPTDLDALIALLERGRAT